MFLGYPRGVKVPLCDIALYIISLCRTNSLGSSKESNLPRSALDTHHTLCMVVQGIYCTPPRPWISPPPCPHGSESHIQALARCNLSLCLPNMCPPFQPDHESVLPRSPISLLFAAPGSPSSPLKEGRGVYNGRSRAGDNVG